MLRTTTTLWALVLLGASATGTAFAQDEEQAGEARGDYAWSQGGGTTGASLGDDPMRIMAYAGAGAGFRLVRNIDPEFDQDFATPAYLDLGAGLYLEGGDVRHGPALFVSANLIQDPGGLGAGPFEQWVLTPGYQVLLPFRRILGMDHDWLHLQGRIGIPLVFSAQDGQTYVTPGAELAAALHFKFLAGLGVYLEVQANLYGGFKETVHPTLSADFGFLFDYEVLP
ncbi:MAG TPA: hypothetical protein RMH99_24660 [Sandaracinaceae bacterium LLY-WYZ-13_1]|nr:hypothetical protein [Sandaracinaceae bacterium LLY-WYZ-13_1]